MICRHSANDPSCSSHRDYVEPYRAPATPDSSNYTIEEIEKVGEHLVMKVKYPNCSNCEYEGCKVMVFLRCGFERAIHWRRIDPHFRSTKGTISKTEAPSPAARFPGGAEGWQDALAYARGKK